MNIKWFTTIRETCSKMDKTYSKMSQVKEQLKYFFFFFAEQPSEQYQEVLCKTAWEYFSILKK